VGRLDLDTSGLLLLSSEGDLTHLILHPDSGIEKEYEAVVQGFPVEDSLRQVLQAGVPSKSPHDPRNYSGEVLSVQSNKVRLVVTEGRHRMVRRMLANAGFPVLELHRSRIGGLELTSLQLTPGAVVAVNANTVLGSRYAN
jgi:pseudouridine synthase